MVPIYFAYLIINRQTFVHYLWYNQPTHYTQNPLLRSS